MKQHLFMTLAAAAVLVCITGCSSLVRKSPPPNARKTVQPRENTRSAPKKAAQKELTAAQIAAMTPEQLIKYHQDKQKSQAKDDATNQRFTPPPANTKRNESSQSLVNSFMHDRPSREKRRRLGDVSRQLNYSESSVFPWRSERRSETLKRR